MDFPLADGDVIVAGESHSAYVFRKPYVSHFRGTPRLEWLKQSREFRPLKELLAVPVDALPFYPRNVKDKLCAAAGDRAAARVLSEMEKKGIIGFFHDRDTLGRAMARISLSGKPEVFLWRRPEGLKIIYRRGPGSDAACCGAIHRHQKKGQGEDVLTLFEGEYVSFKAAFVYSHLESRMEFVATGAMEWEPAEIFNGAGFVEGRKVGSSRRKIVVRHRKYKELAASVFLELEPEPAILGQWDWFNGGTVLIEGSPESGRMRQTAYDGRAVNSGIWKRTNPYERLYELRWQDGGWVDILMLSRDGTVLKGTNNRRHVVSGVRKDDDREKLSRRLKD